jgi:hypothetical protein
VCPWRLDQAGQPVYEPGADLPVPDLDPALRAELAAVLREHQARWVIVGPCLDGGWYAAPRRDRGGARVPGRTLADLAGRLRDQGHRA